MASIDVQEANIGIAQDEERIKNHYRNNIFQSVFCAALMLGVTYQFELKWVVGFGFGILIMVIVMQDARYFDIATRISRTNSLLRDHTIIRGHRSYED